MDMRPWSTMASIAPSGSGQRPAPVRLVTPSTGRLPRALLAAYAAPALPLAAMYFPVYVFLAEFYATAHGLPLGSIGVVFIAARLFDAVSDPVAGIASDRWTTRWGRRRPWLAAGAPLVMLSAWMLFVPAAGAGLPGFAALAVPADARLDDHAHALLRLGRRTDRGLRRARPGLGLARDGGPRRHDPRGGALFPRRRLPPRACATSPCSSSWRCRVACLLCLAVVPEPRNFSRVSASLGSLARVLSDEPLFARLILAFFVNSAANALPAGLFLFFVGQRLGAPAWGGPLLIVYFGAAVLAAPLWPWLVRRHSKHRVWCWAMLYACVVFAAALLLREGDLVAFAIICVLSGAALGADLSLPTAIQADVVDLDTARTGDQRTGAFFALWSLAQKFALAGSGGRGADRARVDRLFASGERTRPSCPDRPVAALRAGADRAEARRRRADVELSARGRGAGDLRRQIEGGA